MDTPICDFVRAYIDARTGRLHMPGHKGHGPLGIEALDITEIRGADSLYEAEGIIAQSEENASSLFGCPTLYATEGSSQCIRAMVYLLCQAAKAQGKRPRIAAGRNAHKAFLTAAALLGVEVSWLYPEKQASYLSCPLTAEELEDYLEKEAPTALYLTSPDYLGALSDIAPLAEVCHRHGVLLAVDNAHGAYLKFLHSSRHPMDLGADICCDSAHKTLPVLTGGAYLHLSERFSIAQGKNALMLFGSTSPSYLILQSLDAANAYLETYPQRLRQLLPGIRQLKKNLRDHGFSLYGSEELKLTLDTKAYGYRGTEFADLLRKANLEPEFADPDYVVLMLSAEMDPQLLQYLEETLCRIPRRAPVLETPPRFSPGEKVLSIREAALAPWELLPAEQCLGRILAVPAVGCPPAVPILVCGERIDENAVRAFTYYGIPTCPVVKEV